MPNNAHKALDKVIKSTESFNLEAFKNAVKTLANIDINYSEIINDYLGITVDTLYLNSMYFVLQNIPDTVITPFINVLLQNNFDSKQKCYNVNNALEMASRNGKFSAFKILISQASIPFSSHEINRALCLACYVGIRNIDFGIQNFQRGSSNSYLLIVKYLIKHCDANINAIEIIDKNISHPLENAILSEDENMIKFLLLNGANLKEIIDDIKGKRVTVIRKTFDYVYGNNLQVMQEMKKQRKPYFKLLLSGVKRDMLSQGLSTEALPELECINSYLGEPTEILLKDKIQKKCFEPAIAELKNHFNKKEIMSSVFFQYGEKYETIIPKSLEQLIEDYAAPVSFARPKSIRKENKGLRLGL